MSFRSWMRLTASTYLECSASAALLISTQRSWRACASSLSESASAYSSCILLCASSAASDAATAFWCHAAAWDFASPVSPRPPAALILARRSFHSSLLARHSFAVRLSSSRLRLSTAASADRPLAFFWRPSRLCASADASELNLSLDSFRLIASRFSSATISSSGRPSSIGAA